MPPSFLRSTLAGLLALASLATSAQTPAYDLLLKNALIVDGTGNPWFRGDLAIKGDAIATIAYSINTPTSEVIELARVAGRFGGSHVSHQRDDASGVIESVKETIAIGEQGGLSDAKC
jgi:hypothetical protein